MTSNKHNYLTWHILILLCLLSVVSLLISILYLTPHVSAAQGNYKTAELAAHALTFVGKHGSQACAYAGKTGGGQCKQFVNCIVFAVSGQQQWPVGGYHSGFEKAGGVQVSRGAAERGDIIQVGNSDSDYPLHTAIVLSNHGNGIFTVVDSNYNYDEIVRTHDYTPAANAKFWRMGQSNGPAGPVIGSLDSIRRAPGGIRVSGWSIDQDTPSATYVHLYSGDGELRTSNPGKELYANQYRADVGQAYSQYGPGHGYSGVVAAKSAGNQRICAYGINVSGTPGNYARLGCEDINVSPDPFGYLDTVKRVSGGVQVSGWSIDPDTASSIEVHVYAGDGSPSSKNPAKSVTANVSRSDLIRHYPDYGDKHGYSAFVPTSSGAQNVCVYAINNATNGHNPQLGCKKV